MVDSVTVPGSSIRWILLCAKMLELDVKQLLTDADIDSDLMFSHDEQIPLECAEKIREIVHARFPSESFTLEIGQTIPLGELGIVDYVCVQSSCLAEALENLCRYFRLVAHPNLGLSFLQDENGGYLETEINNLAYEKPGWFERQSVEFTFSVTLSRIHYASKRKIIPERLYLRHPAPQNLDAYTRIFGPHIHFNCEKNAMVFSKEQLSTLSRTADFRLYKILREYVDDAIAKLPNTTEIETRVAHLLEERMQSGEITLTDVSTTLHMSPRTLHRKLTEAGTSFNELRERLRRELARNYLRDQTMSIADISYLLGFSQVSAFHRAFKRWTGETPLNYRAAGGSVGKEISSRDSR